jgi:hypothetical protein
MRRLSWLRVAAALLPAALLMHEAVYAFADAPDTGSHTYLAEALPLLAVLGGSLLLAALLLPALQPRNDGDGAAAARPFAIALALVTLFALQEGTEIMLLGGGVGQLVAVLTTAWLLLPLALLLGSAGAAAVEALARAGAGIARLVRSRDRRHPRRPTQVRLASFSARGRRFSPLAFGIACRPPPSLA